VALLFVALTPLWLASGGAPLPPTIDARIRQTPALATPSASTPDSQLSTPKPLEVGSWKLGVVSWDPYEFGGRLRIAEPQTFLYPPVLRTWASDAWLTLVSYVLHVWLGAFAVYVLARRLNVGPLTGLVLALAYVLTTTLAVPPARVSSEVVFRAAWLPLLAAAILTAGPAKAGHYGGPAKAGHYIVAIGVVIAFAGSPRTQAYGLLTLVAAYAFAVVWKVAPLKGAPYESLKRAPSGSTKWAPFGVGLLILSISAPASFPTLRLWRSAQRSGGLMSSEPFNGSWRADSAQGVGINPELADALRQLRPARVISTCADIVDAVHLRALGVRSVGGYGGVYAADYATFVNLIRNQTPTAPLPYVGMARSGEPRLDLQQFLNAEYQVTCESAQGELVKHVDEVRIYRTPTLGAAVWTCYPNRVGRKEAEYRLSTRRYDETLSLRNPGPKINVRWAPDVDDAAREAAEVKFHLVQDGQPEGRTRHYELLDPSRENVEAMVTNPAVEDTAGLDRLTLAFNRVPEPRFDERPTEWLIGLEPCPELRRASLVRQTDEGQTIVDIDAPTDGVALFSETFYRSRTALVDQEPASVLRVNLAFAAVPVPAGRHRVQLDVRPEPRRLYWVVSVLGMAVWGVTLVTGRRRRLSAR